MSTIYKSAWLCIKDRKVLFARSANNHDTFYLPGGKREAGESDVDALVREVKEETAVTLDENSIELAETFRAHAHGKPKNVEVVITAYFADFDGELTASSEIVELAWLTSADVNRLYGVGVQTVSWLKEKDLID